MPDKITIGIYRTEQNCDFDSEKGKQEIIANLKTAVNDMLYIKKKMDAAARKVEKELLCLDISVLLIPNWELEKRDTRIYQSFAYEQKKQIFMELFNQVVRDALFTTNIDRSQVQVLDFLETATLTESEKDYMEELKALGSNADIIKTRAIINNGEYRHLQLDSNTKIYNFDSFYHNTFGLNAQEDAFDVAIDASQDTDAFNASYYDESYVSVHNKIAYTVPGSLFVDNLKQVYFEYCEQHKSDMQSKEKNSIYSKVFTEAAYRTGIARKYEVPIGEESIKVIYPAKMENETAFRITRNVVTAVNQSWKPNQDKPLGYVELTRISGMEYGDTFFDYACYRIVMKKLTGDLGYHKLYDDVEPSFEQSEIARSQLLKLSDQVHERKALMKFERHSIKQIAENNDWSDDKKSAMFYLMFCNHFLKEEHILKQIIKSDISLDNKNIMLEFFLEDKDQEEKRQLKFKYSRGLFNYSQKEVNIPNFSMYSQSSFYHSPNRQTISPKLEDNLDLCENQKKKFSNFQSGSK